MLVNARKEADLVHPETNQHLELDIFLPSLNLAFEYQVCFISIFVHLYYVLNSTNNNNKKKDKSHYVNVGAYSRSVDHIQSMDKLKQQLAQEKGITVIPIPCWWDGTKSR